MEKLIKIINNITPLSNSLQMYLSENIRPILHPQKHILLEVGKVSTRMYFVEYGLLRGYYLKDGKEVTTWVMPENEFVISILSFYTQQPSYEYIEVLEDSKLWYLSHEKVENVYKTFPEFNIVGRVLTERYYVMSELRAYYLRMHSAEERLQLLLHDFPTILARVKNRHVSSLLGITPETLSRILAKRL